MCRDLFIVMIGACSEIWYMWVQLILYPCLEIAECNDPSDVQIHRQGAEIQTKYTFIHFGPMVAHVNFSLFIHASK